MIKVGFFNTYKDNGGASIASFRIANSIDSNKIFKKFFVLENSSSHLIKNESSLLLTFPFLKISKFLLILDKLFLIKYLKRKKQIFSNSRFFNLISFTSRTYSFDIVHLFWVSAGLLNIQDLGKIRAPIIWTLHDMYPMTGGCHYDDHCGNFKLNCGKCPVLNSNFQNDLSFKNLTLKINSWKNLNLHIVGTSKWISEQAAQSAIFKGFPIYTIPNPIDTNIFKPYDKKYAKSFFNLNNEKLHIFFSAHGALTDKRKGVDYLFNALSFLEKENDLNNIELTILGSNSQAEGLNTKLKINFVPFTDDEHIRILLYSASDIMIAPSLQENLSNTVMESLACGLPVIAFNIGGMPDLILDKECGFLVDGIDHVMLARSIYDAIIDGPWRETASIKARNFVIENFSNEVIGKKYEDLYEKVSG